MYKTLVLDGLALRKRQNAELEAAEMKMLQFDRVTRMDQDQG